MAPEEQYLRLTSTCIYTYIYRHMQLCVLTYMGPLTPEHTPQNSNIKTNSKMVELV